MLILTGISVSSAAELSMSVQSVSIQLTSVDSVQAHSKEAEE